MSDEGLRQVLARHGYRLRYREHDWVECLLASSTETFRGEGLDPAAALQDALSKAFPSRISRELLDISVAAASRSLGGTLPSVAPVRSVTEPEELTTAELPGLPAAPAPVSATAVARSGSEPRGVVRMASNRVPPPSPSVGAPLLVRPDAALPPADRVRSMEELSILTDRIEEARPELAWSTAPRQRLAILAWICEARSHTDAFPEDAEIRDAVARVSRQLTEIGKAFWPGSVTALQLQMQPGDLPRHLLGGSPTTWGRAAELAERALAQLEQGDERRGLDLYGWGDSDALSPEPVDAKELLEQLVEGVESTWGPLDRSAEPRNPDDLPDPAKYLKWVRELRWVRSQHVDPDRWARVMGRLRWWAARRNGPVQKEGQELEPTFRPERAWSELLDARGVQRQGPGLPTDLVQTVQGAFGGKRLLCVGHRRDRLEQTRLDEALPDVELEWRLVETSLLDEIPRLISDGGYEAVVGAFGLQSARPDLALVRACRATGTRYVRANRGQPVACLRALARAV